MNNEWINSKHIIQQINFGIERYCNIVAAAAVVLKSWASASLCWGLESNRRVPSCGEEASSGPSGLFGLADSSAPFGWIGPSGCDDCGDTRWSSCWPSPSGWSRLALTLPSPTPPSGAGTSWRVPTDVAAAVALWLPGYRHGFRLSGCCLCGCSYAVADYAGCELNMMLLECCPSWC